MTTLVEIGWQRLQGQQRPVEPDPLLRAQGEAQGVIAVLRDQETSRAFMESVETLGQHPDELDSRRSGDMVLRTYGVGAQILRDLGLSKIRVLSAPKHMYAISGFDLEITEYVAE